MTPGQYDQLIHRPRAAASSTWAGRGGHRRHHPGRPHRYGPAAGAAVPCTGEQRW